MSLLSSQVSKLAWRLEMLSQPEETIRRRPFFDRQPLHPLRVAMLRKARELSLADRVRLLAPQGHGTPPETMLLERLRERDEQGEEFYRIGGLKIYFRPRGFDGDEARLLEGTHLILREAFDQQVEFFQAPVEVAPGDVVLDLGANIGTSAIILAERAGPGGRVYSFEPVFDELLRRNAEANDLRTVHVVPMAVADAPGEAEFAVTDVGVDSRMATATFRNGRTRRVPVTTVDLFVEQEGLDRVDFVKLDIEGAEEPALLGAEQTLRRFRPKLTVASYHDDAAGRPQHPRLVRLLRAWGYEVREAGQQHIYAWTA